MIGRRKALKVKERGGTMRAMELYERAFNEAIYAPLLYNRGRRLYVCVDAGGNTILPLGIAAEAAASAAIVTYHGEGCDNPHHHSG